MDLNTQEVHLSHYWNIIYKRWKVALSIVVVVMLGTYLASEFAKPLYRSSIQIQIERENPNQLTVDDLFGIAASDQEFLQTQYVLLKSRGLAEKVIDDQKLLSDPEFYPAGINGKTPAQIAQIRDVDGGRGRSVRSTSFRYATHRWSTSATSPPTPRLAQKIAEGVGESYIRLNNEKKFESVQTGQRVPGAADRADSRGHRSSRAASCSSTARAKASSPAPTPAASRSSG